MISKAEDGFTVKVFTNLDPADQYTETVNELVDLLQGTAPDMQGNNYYVLELLRAMLPTLEQAKAMMGQNTGKTLPINGDLTLRRCAANK